MPGIFNRAIFNDALFNSAPAAGDSVVRAAPGVRRAFVDVDGQRIEVSGYFEAEKLLRTLKKEEKAQEQDRKKLKIHLKTVEKASVKGALYTKAVERVEVIEARMDTRLEKIAELYAAIQQALDDQDDQDDEEILLLL